MSAGPDLVRGADGRLRCAWGAGEVMRAYHDEEWGRPVADDRRLFEKVSLEGFQSGLSWRTIYLRREAFRRAFAGFDLDRVARFTARKVEALVGDASIIRHRGKIESVVNNARRAREIVAERGSLAAYFWGFEAAEASALSRDLKRRGWSFVGPTTIYAFMQAMGLVNDHEERCFARAAVERERRGFRRP